MSDVQKCGHRAEVAASYVSPTTGEVRRFRVCEPCAALLWDRMAHPLRETFSVEPLGRPS